MGRLLPFGRSDVIFWFRLRPKSCLYVLNEINLGSDTSNPGADTASTARRMALAIIANHPVGQKRHCFKGRNTSLASPKLYIDYVVGLEFQTQIEKTCQPHNFEKYVTAFNKTFLKPSVVFRGNHHLQTFFAAKENAPMQDPPQMPVYTVSKHEQSVLPHTKIDSMSLQRRTSCKKVSTCFPHHDMQKNGTLGCINPPARFHSETGLRELKVNCNKARHIAQHRPLKMEAVPLPKWKP